ncbi:helix-turn-helix domain-containing protein [Saccharopolyspora sp. CA-218241]|uniref:helix-turn-helix domain-containing protein n=1 Tax=Saccharopolyspora sp. CA-218241 TaxID=3240027 RepID=UPI003D9765C1
MSWRSTTLVRGGLRCAEYREDPGFPVVRWELPVPHVVVLVRLGDPPVDDLPPAAVLSPRAPVVLAHHGSTHHVQARLPPTTAYRLFGPLGDLAGHPVPLDAILPPGLPDRLAEAPDRLATLAAALTEAAHRGPEPDPEVRHAWTMLRAGTPVAEVIAETGWSRNRLVRRFAAQTGFTPKAAASLMRFHRATRLLGAAPLTEIAATGGYYDQAHLNRAFRRYAGSTPTEWLRARVPGLPGAGVSSKTGGPGEP